jgi:hypothetical protein
MAGEGLFFTGQVLKNNRDLLAEEAAREQLKLQREELELRKQAAADQRRENRRKNAPKFDAFDQSAVGDFIGGTKRDVDSYIDWVSNNYEGDTPEYYSEEGKKKSNLVSDIGLLSKITSDYDSKMQDLAKGGEGLIKANYVRHDETGSYEFEDRKKRLVQQYNSGEITASEAYAQYFNNNDQSLYKVRQESTLGAGLVEGYKGKGGGDAELFSKDGKKYYGWSDGAKNSIYEKYKDELRHTPEKGFETQQGERAYFNSVFDNENAQVLFFREAKDKPSVQEGDNILSQLDPSSKDYDAELSNEYIEYLAKKDSDRYMSDKGTVTSTKDVDEFKDLQPKANWLGMIDSQEFTEQTYGAHGKMLEEYKLSQPPKKVTLTNTLIDTLEVSDRTLGIDTDTARKLIRQLDQKEIDLGQVMINESKDKMYGIFEITIPADLYKKGGSPTIEFSVPLDQIDEKNYGGSVKTWSDSFNNRSVYGEETTETTKPTGGSAPRPN